MPVQVAQGAVGFVGRDLGLCGRELLLGPEKLRPKTALLLLGSLGLAFRRLPSGGPILQDRVNKAHERSKKRADELSQNSDEVSEEASALWRTAKEN